MKKLLILFLFPALCYAQPKINIRTMTSVPGGSGIGLIGWSGNTVDTLTAPADSMIPISFNGNTEIGWISSSSFGSGGGSGTVSSVGSGYGLLGGPITTTGSLYVDSTYYTSVYANGLKLNISDTAGMLGNYLQTEVASSTYATLSGLNLKVNISDTAAMLSNYLQTGVAAATYAPISITGTVTGVATGYGINGGTITTSGTLSADTSSGNALVSKTRLTNTLSAYGPGTVTSVSAGYGTTFSAITSTGSVVADTSILVNKTGVQLLTNKFISGSANTLSNIGNSSLTNSTISGVALGSTLGAHSVGYGLSGSNYTGAGAIAWTADTSSSTALVSKTRLTNTLGTYVNALTTIGSTANGNGASISGSTLQLQPASVSFGGVVNTTTQTFAGAKTFNSTITASGSPGLTIGTYGQGIRGTASSSTTWLQFEQSNANPMMMLLANTTSDYTVMEVMDPGGVLNTDNFEFSTLGSGYATSGLISASSTLAWTRSGLTNGLRLGTASGPVILFSGGSATTNERMRIVNGGGIAVSGGATPLTVPTAYLHIAAGTATANTCPFKLTSGTLNSTAEAGSHEFNGNHFLTKASALRFAIGGSIADFTADANNTGTGETDLYTYTTPASTLANTGEKLTFEFSGNFSDVTATCQLQFYFAGTNIGNSTALVVNTISSWSATGMIIRTGASTARAIVRLMTPGCATASYTLETDLTGLTFTNTNIIKCTGTATGAGGGSSDITAKLGAIYWFGQANN